MKLAMIAALSIATAATALPLSGTAQADPTGYTFLSPSGNIGCELRDDAGGTIFAMCKTQNRSWVASPTENCQKAQVPGAIGEPGSDVMLGQGKTPCVGFSANQFFFPPDPLATYPTLGYGQSRSVGSITCGSEPSGVTCTDASTGHFFRVSRDSYQLG